jgi:exo-beta-1,3-glucanase (GH17 family)
MKPTRRSTLFHGVARLLCLLGGLIPIAFADAATISLQQKPTDLLGGESRAICYSGFRRGQHPDRGAGAINPSDAEILEDLEILVRHGFSLIRLYDSQVNSAAVLRLIDTHKLNLKVLLGAWLAAEVSNPGCPWQKEPYSEEVLAANKIRNEKEVTRAAGLANQYPATVIAVAVGNEALVAWNDHMVPVGSVIRYVRQMKQSVSQPVTVADNYDWWAKHGGELAKELDFVSVHIYPQWEEKDVEEAIAFGIANMDAVRRALPDRPLVITEAGWATTASEFGVRADEVRQKRYYHELFQWAGRMNITTFFFEAFDESWKGDPNNPLGAEKHWGVFTEARTPKLVMKP